MAPLPSQIFEVPPAQGGFIAEELGSSCKAEFTCMEQRLLIRAKPPRGGLFKHLRQTLAPAEHIVSSCRLQKSAVGHRELPPRAANCRGAAGKGERGVLCFCWGGCAPTDGAGRVSYTSVPQFIQLFHLGHSHLALIFSDKDLEKLSAPSLLVPNQHLCVADMIGVKCCN